MNVYWTRRHQARIDDLSLSARPRLTRRIVEPPAPGPQGTAYSGPWRMDLASHVRCPRVAPETTAEHVVSEHQCCCECRHDCIQREAEMDIPRTRCLDLDGTVSCAGRLNYSQQEIVHR